MKNIHAKDVHMPSMESEPYTPPLCTLTEISSEGILCSSLQQLEDDEQFYFEW